MVNSITRAKTVTEALKQKLTPHMDDAPILGALGSFLPVASQALDTIGLFEAEIPDVLEQYTSTCEKLTKAIQTAEDSLIQRAWKDVTIEGKSWADHMKAMQLYIQILQLQAQKKKIETPLPQYEAPPPTQSVRAIEQSKTQIGRHPRRALWIKELSNSSVDEDVREWDRFVGQQQHQRLQRTGVLAELRQEPANESLQAYLQRLKRGPENTDDNGSPIWDPVTFIEGVRRFSELLGNQRSRYYDNPLKGLHYPHTLLTQWARSYPSLPSPLWQDDFRWQCPRGWLSRIETPHNAWVLFYNGTDSCSQALNELILGPTTVDCGMCAPIVLWFAMRYTFGDDLFDGLFPFRRLPFILTQKWHLPFRMEEDLTRGNWLHDFFDIYTDESLDTTSKMQPTIQVRTVYNHPEYLLKHPAGAARLQNIIQIGAECIVFSPLGPSIISMDELDLSLLEAFNEEQTRADLAEVELFNTEPDYVDLRRGSRRWGDLAVEAAALAGCTLSKTEWDESLPERTKLAGNLRVVFNIDRLIQCVTRFAALDGEYVEEEIFRAASRMKRMKALQTTIDMMNKKLEEIRTSNKC